jgi:CheY-like chemotaxis protein/anti-sigma regulatory factor (Ser/Thr protein kinase)
VDHIRFRQVILNLLSNAVKYNNEGGQVDIGCDLEEGQYACIRIQDTGSGIPLDKQVALFEPFDRLGAEQSGVEGSGIGLVITRHLVELMHGDMGLESEVGKGTTFWIKLPLAERPTASEDMQPAEDERDELTSSSGKQKPRYRVLYVEDNLANQKLVGEILKRYQDIDMLTTESAEKGLELAVTQQPDFILLDINLPGMNGFECVAQLKAREQTSQIPVVAVSANAMPEDIARGMAAGFSAYVTKPVNVQQLFQTIDGIVDSLDSRQRMSTFTRIN